MSRLRTALLLALVGVLAVPTPMGSLVADQKGKASPEEVMGAMTVRFLKYAQWPKGRFEEADSPIVLGVIGDRTVYASAKRSEKTDIEGHSLRVIQLPPFDAKDEKSVAQWKRCHAVFIEAASKPEEILAFARTAHILTVSNLTGFADRG
ncbi:MAG: YfiR family protein, partial [Planctomycetes bacterium]|nr:YfiR family protein [Planctomycetota bacterium]